MLFVHTSNTLENLKNAFVAVNRKKQGHIFDSELVVVQNSGMSRWLSLNVAELDGISANLEFLFPAEFMWKLLQIVSHKTENIDQCSPDSLRFHLFTELFKNSDNYPEIKHYLSHNTESNAWNLSAEMAQLLDKYLFYRSDWIQKWEAPNWDSSDHWQSRLWKNCITKKTLTHWLSIQESFKLNIGQVKQTDIPSRVSFFSMSALSPGYIELMAELGTKTDVHFYVIDPSPKIYWGDNKSIKSQLKHGSFVDDLSNPLLTSFGQQGKDFIENLLNLSVSERQEIADKQDKPKSVLGHLQSDINTNSKPSAGLENLDNSFIINSCHTPLREVEVLHDHILQLMNVDESLNPNDFIVMMPDIDLYAPYIESVFTTSQQNLPFSISDRKPSSINKLIQAIELLFNLPENNYDVDSVFELLEHDVILEQFKLEEDHVDFCRRIVKDTNIRWGINKKTRKSNDQPNTQEHTWEYAINRMLLGYALSENRMEEGQSNLFISDYYEMSDLPLLAYVNIEGINITILSNFKRFIDHIFDLQNWLDKSFVLTKWITKIKQFLTILFPHNDDYQSLLTAISDLETLANETNFNVPISYLLFRQIFNDFLQKTNTQEGFLSNGISFSAMVPMRSVPFKVVCLLGMNEGAFPRQDKPFSFDLMRDKYRQGDRSKRLEDKYLFLESILAARKHLLISYIGQNVKDNSPLPPSLLLSELIEVIATMTRKDINTIICKHPLQAFSSQYYNQRNDSLFSFNSKFLQLTREKSYVEEKSSFINHPLNDEYKIQEDRLLSLNDLVTFYTQPAKTFLHINFDLKTSDKDDSFEIREPFKVEPFNDHYLREVLNSNLPYSDKLNIARAEGLLPYGEIGDEIAKKEQHSLDIFRENVQPCDYSTPNSKEFEIIFKSTILTASLNNISDKGRCINTIDTLYLPMIIKIWLEHLALNCINTNNQNITAVFTPENTFSLEPVENAKEILSNLIDFYFKGLNYPISFFPKSSSILFKENLEGNYSKSATTWHGSELLRGEKEKFENWLLHRSTIFDKNNVPKEFQVISEVFFKNLYLHINT